MVRGAYAYGWENAAPSGAAADGKQTSASDSGRESPGPRIKTLALALNLLERRQAGPLQELVQRRYPLSTYRDALDDAFHAGRKETFKVVFEIGP